MAENHDIAAEVHQLAADWGQKVIVDWQDFWSANPSLSEEADEVLSRMTGLYKALVTLGGS